MCKMRKGKRGMGCRRNLVCRSRRGEVGKRRKKKTGDKLADARAAIGLTSTGKRTPSTNFWIGTNVMGGWD